MGILVCANLWELISLLLLLHVQLLCYCFAIALLVFLCCCFLCPRVMATNVGVNDQPELELETDQSNCNKKEEGVKRKRMKERSQKNRFGSVFYCETEINMVWFGSVSKVKWCGVVSKIKKPN